MNGLPRGTLRVVATVAFGKAQLLPILPRFLEDHPEVRISLELTDRPVNPALDDVDVAIRFSEQVEDANAIQRKLAPNRRVLCAAPNYVARRGAPRGRRTFSDTIACASRRTRNGTTGTSEPTRAGSCRSEGTSRPTAPTRSITRPWRASGSPASPPTLSKTIWSAAVCCACCRATSRTTPPSSPSMPSGAIWPRRSGPSLTISSCSSRGERRRRRSSAEAWPDEAMP
jgi:DNA-binding transcriptional LysR family regulator